MFFGIYLVSKLLSPFLVNF